MKAARIVCNDIILMKAARIVCNDIILMKAARIVCNDIILMKAARIVCNDIILMKAARIVCNDIILMNAARIVCNDIISSNGFNFNASFPQAWQKESLSVTLKLLVTMLLRGADIVDQDSSDSLACLSVAQTILFNCKKRPLLLPKRELPLGRVGIPWSTNHL